MPVSEDRKFSAITNPIDQISSYSCIIGGVCLVAIFALIAAEITARNFLGTSLPFSWDFAAYMMGACIFLSAGATLKAGGHVRVTALHDYLPPKGQQVLDAVACLIGLAIALVILYAVSDMAMLSLKRGSTSSSVVRTPLWIPQGFMVVGALVFTLQMFAQVLRTVGGETLHNDADIEDQL
ncbi:TRAP-type C4-dicarboxylate transport system, small permease component [Cohaesibacter marisflavi]|uniref:TRAP transporter small permease protein n=1 Tax=Cohaesibacter marisflavi TaxID=655353 RepID=A0A1I4ZF56_9HYPH|nr:TRAP transporter small permease [Cohaesibacter marisflavi]SFN48904.1 TRAP-type C4-dicarboxylate transport system, small permease component [Cohaesibacter marisflavi]